MLAVPYRTVPVPPQNVDSHSVKIDCFYVFWIRTCKCFVHMIGRLCAILSVSKLLSVWFSDSQCFFFFWRYYGHYQLYNTNRGSKISWNCSFRGLANAFFPWKVLNKRALKKGLKFCCFQKSRPWCPTLVKTTESETIETSQVDVCTVRVDEYLYIVCHYFCIVKRKYFSRNKS